MKNSRTETFDYYVSAALLKDWTVEETNEFHPDFGELSTLRKKVMVGMTEKDYKLYMSKQWVEKMLYLRRMCIDQVNNETKTKAEEIIWMHWQEDYQ
jgi:hypothetical protein